MRRWLALGLLVVLGLVLAGFSGSPERERVSRKAVQRDLASQAPKRTVYRFESGEMVVLDIATIGPRGFADSQRCFLWRDSEFKTASLQCPNDSPGDFGNTEPEKNSP